MTVKELREALALYDANDENDDEIEIRIVVNTDDEDEDLKEYAIERILIPVEWDPERDKSGFGISYLYAKTRLFDNVSDDVIERIEEHEAS